MHLLLIVIFIVTNSIHGTKCQCFPIDGRISGSWWPSLLTASSGLNHGRDLGGSTTTTTFMIDGDMLSSNFMTAKRSQLDYNPKNNSNSSLTGVQSSSSSTNLDRNSWKNLLWPGNVIPFNYHSSIDDFKKNLIQQAMEYFESKTCIKFMNKTQSDEYWITFRSDSSGCFAFLGRDISCRGQGQPVSLSRGCDTFLIAAHEIAHVIGLKHQHNRPDRDEYIHINWNNIATVNQRYFKKDKNYDFWPSGLPYDYTSLMQYNMWHFSSNIYNKSSMVTLDPMYQRLLGKSSAGLSFYDRKQVNFMYSCNESCSNLDTNECNNGGYLYPVDSKSKLCECQCPPNFTGKRCEIETHESYYDAIDPLICGRVINGSDFDLDLDNSIDSFNLGHTVIETINYPGQRNPNVLCSWIINIPSSATAVLRFDTFNLASRSNSVETTWSRKCINESLEIRSENQFEGQFYCGSDIKNGQSMAFHGPKQVILHVQSFDGKSGGTFSSVLTFETDVRTSTAATSGRPNQTGSEGHVDESGLKDSGLAVLGFPVNSLMKLPLEIITSLIKSLNQVMERG